MRVKTLRTWSGASFYQTRTSAQAARRTPPSSEAGRGMGRSRSDNRTGAAASSACASPAAVHSASVSRGTNTDRSRGRFPKSWISAEGSAGKDATLAAHRAPPAPT